VALSSSGSWNIEPAFILLENRGLDVELFSLFGSPAMNCGVDARYLMTTMVKFKIVRSVDPKAYDPPITDGYSSYFLLTIQLFSGQAFT
jgi:hypothetical protein